jgi:hypothetical protein
MANLSLREAAQQAGVSKSTIWRSIKSGRLSAGRSDDGEFAVDPSELFRVFPPKQVAQALEQAVKRDATHAAAVETDTGDQFRLAALEAELRVLRELLDEMRASKEELRADLENVRLDRDHWRVHAGRVALAASGATGRAESEGQTVNGTLAISGPDNASGRRPWWRRLAG